MNTPSKPVHVSLGAYGRVPFDIAVADAKADPPVDPMFGVLSTKRLQLCPQNNGVINLEAALKLRQQYPDTEFRLHANVRVADKHQVFDLCHWPEQKDYFKQLAVLSSILDAPAYSAHAGKRQCASVEEVIRYSKAMTESFGIPVAIEGHYPTQGDTWLFSHWHEYQQLLESGAYFALDLSHLHIVATQTGITETRLVEEMLSSERCLEIHVSGNNGIHDQHLPLDDKPWWWQLVDKVHEHTVIFSEARIAPR